MARRTAALKPQLNQIRTWAREGRTDAWIAYQLGTTSLTVQEFRSEYALDKPPRNPVEEPVTPELVVQTISFDSPPPLPPLDDAPAPDEAAAKATDERPRRQRRARPVKVDDESLEVEVIAESTADGEVAEAVAEADAEPERARRRRRRGGRGAGAAAAADGDSPASEPATADGEAKPSPRRKPRGAPAYTGSIVAGAVLVLDPAVTRSAAWRANWADAPELDITLEDDQIVLRRRPSA
ncbi:MAG TPA: hypothetical protein VGF46_09230 [Gaiellales bacterium]